MKEITTYIYTQVEDTGDAERKTLKFKITMRKLEIIHSMFPRCKLGGTSHEISDFFKNGTSLDEVDVSQKCSTDVEEDKPKDVRKFLN